MTTGGWWEKANADVVVSIVGEMARNCNVEFAGSIVRPHADAMLMKGRPTVVGESILKKLKEAGSLFISTGAIPRRISDEIGKPLIDEKAYADRLNQAYFSA